MAAAFEISELMGDGEVEEFFEEPDFSKLFNVNEIKSLALKYQLMSRHTNYLAIDVRPENEKAEDLPALRKTPQMLAAGWGGVGNVMEQKVSIGRIREDFDFDSMSELDVPVFLRRKIETSEFFSACERLENSNKEEPAGFIDRLNQTHEGSLSSVLPSSRNRLASVIDLETLGIPTTVLEALTALVEEGADERSVVATFLYLLGEEGQIKDRLSRTTRRILAVNPDIRILALSMHTEKIYVKGMLSAGASGYVLKSCSFRELLTAIETVLTGRIYVSPEIAHLLVADSSDTLTRLSNREKQVLVGIAEGHSTRQIAENLHLSVKTIDVYRRSLKAKLDIQSVAGLTKYAIAKGLISPGPGF